jgi:hypothetical protein
MKKIIFTIVIIFVFAVPVLAGKNVESQPEKKIIVAFSNSACRDYCRDDLNRCTRNCNSWGDDAIHVKHCTDNCTDDYDRCIKKCD